MYKIIERTKLWFAISIIIILIGVGFIVTKGLNWGIDFKGGTIVSVNIGKSFDKSEADIIVKKYAKDAASVTLNNTVLEIKSTELNTVFFFVNTNIKQLKRKNTVSCVFSLFCF